MKNPRDEEEDDFYETDAQQAVENLPAFQEFIRERDFEDANTGNN